MVLADLLARRLPLLNVLGQITADGAKAVARTLVAEIDRPPL